MSGVFFRSLLAALAARDVNSAALAEGLGVSATDLANPDLRVSIATYYRAWTDGPALTGDPDFGLHAGQMLPVGAYDVLDYILRSSSTVGDAIRKSTRYFDLMSDAAALELVVETDGVRVRQRPRMRDDPKVPRHAGECLLSLLLARWKLVTGRDWSLRTVSFSHPRPPDVSQHERIFAAPIYFDRQFNELSFDAALLDLPLLTAEPTLNDVLGRQAERLLLERAPVDTFAGRVRRAVAEAAQAGDFTVDAVAGRVRMKRRTLQKRLQASNLSAESMMDAKRHELALRYLEERNLAIAEVGALLGFGDLSAFYRAFKRWTGTTPRKYLQRQD